MHVDDYKLIDRYLQDDLKTEELSAFQQRLKKEEDFAKALTTQKQMNQYLRAKISEPALKEKMQQLGEQYFAEEKTAKIRPLWQRSLSRIVGVAAAIALLLVVWNPFQNGNLYQQYARHPTLALVQRGGQVDYAETAQQAYKNKDFEAAYSALKNLLAQEPENTQAQLALGISALETDRSSEAKTLFKSIADGNSVFQEYGQWYLALTYVKVGDVAAAKRTLKDFSPEDANLQKKAADFMEE